MSRWMKLGIVLGGYALALLASIVAVLIWDRHFTPADNQAMGGMIAGGEMMYGIGLFLMGALVPTGLALWWLQRHRPTWSVFTVVCLAFAIFGLAAALTMNITQSPGRGDGWAILVELFGLAQMLGSPLWIAGFGLFALLAPARDLRLRMLAAAGIEVVIAGCAMLHFFATHPPI